MVKLTGLKNINDKPIYKTRACLFFDALWVQHGPFTYHDEEGKKIYSGEYKDGEVDWAEEH